MKLRGVIFDFNGVIVDDFPLQKVAWDKVSLKLRGRGVSDEEMMQNIRGVQTKEAIRWMLKNPLTEEEIASIAKEKEDYVKRLYAVSPLFCLNKGLNRFFDELKKNHIPHTIATSANLKNLQFSFSKLGLSQWFNISEVVYNDGNCKSKPAPDAYLLAAKKIKLDPKVCVVFEDAVSGIIAAYAAGIRYIIAIGNDERLAVLKKLPGVVKGIHNFSKLKVNELFAQVANR